MSIYYLDTSAVIKLYIDEPGTEAMVRLLDEIGSNDRLYTSWITFLEQTSVISRLAKGGHVEADAADSILTDFRRQIGGPFLPWPIEESILTEALAVVEQHTHRSPDAIHLATALSIFRLASPEQGVLVSSDHELLAGATDSGMDVLNPQDEVY